MASVINGTNIVLYKYDTNKQYYFNGSINQGVTVNGFACKELSTEDIIGTSTAYSTSVIGGSGIFASGNWLDVAANSAFSFTGNFTVECWVYQTSRGNNGVVTEIGLYTDGVMIRLGTIGGIYDAVYVNNVSIGAKFEVGGVYTGRDVAPVPHLRLSLDR